MEIWLFYWNFNTHICTKNGVLHDLICTMVIYTFISLFSWMTCFKKAFLSKSAGVFTRTPILTSRKLWGRRELWGSLEEVIVKLHMTAVKGEMVAHERNCPTFFYQKDVAFYFHQLWMNLPLRRNFSYGLDFIALHFMMKTSFYS